MKKTIIAVALAGALNIIAAMKTGDTTMQDIKFSLGKNIAATAEATKIAEFRVSNVDGMIEYSVLQIPPEMVVVFQHPGQDIKIKSVFGLTLDADRKRTPDDIVHRASVSITGREVKSHAAGRAVVDDLIAQFEKGKWKRYIAARCPAVTGRSSFLDESGSIDSHGCAIDPQYKFNSDEWNKIFAQTGDFEWTGDGIYASLSVGYDDDIRGITYNILITFRDYKTMLTENFENEQRKNELGAQKGWNSSANAAENKKKIAARIIVLEKNALKRGDTIVARE